MTAPWIEIEEVREPDFPAAPGYSEYSWQGMFACQVEVLPHQEWVKLKWGFNASALFDETLERQRLFLESQYAVRSETGVESPDSRTLAFRFINRPGEGIWVVVVGKIRACSRAEANDETLSYFQEVTSTFPYDYTLVPAVNRQEFMLFTGKDILDGNHSQSDLVQIKRLEIPIHLERNSPFLQGTWQSAPRAHEQIWRSLAASSSPLMLNISLRSTSLYEKEREGMLRSMEEITGVQNHQVTQKIWSVLKQWGKESIERRMVPWKKFFYVQVHLASTQTLREHLFRTVGTSLTLSTTQESHPGYRAVRPTAEVGQSWRRKLAKLDLIFSGSYLAVPRLSEVADLDEVFAVMRLPYSPPENGLPEVNFITSRNR